MKLIAYLSIAMMLCAPAGLKAQNSSENMIENPMLWADVPDPDIIRVGDTFYLVSTTMHLMPGAPMFTDADNGPHR